MASGPLFEGDVVLFYCNEAKGYVYAEPPCSAYSHVTIQSSNSYLGVGGRGENDAIPVLPNIQLGAFQVVPVCHSSEDGKTNMKLDSYRRTLVYGRKVKLYHRATDSYVHISPVSRENKNPVGTLMCAKDIRDSGDTFRILPAKPEKHRGEDILIEDQVILECLAMKGNHVFFAQNSLTQRYEMKQGVTDSVLVIHPYTTDQSQFSQHGAIQAGDPVMLFNVKDEAYISFEGSFAQDALPDEIKAQKSELLVIAKSRKNFRGFRKPPPISGDSFWQLEKLKDPLSGNQLQYSVSYRIKHIPTQQYIAVTSSNQVCLCKLESVKGQDELCFTLVPRYKETDGVTNGSYVVLKHKDKFLAIETKKRKRSQSRHHDAVETSTAFGVYLVEASDVSRLVTFKLEMVTADVVRDLYRVIALVTVLSRFMRQFDPDKSSLQPFLDELDITVTVLKKWLTEKANKSRTNMLRATMLLDLLFGFLVLLNDKADENVKKFCMAINDVLAQYVECSNKKSHRYMADTRFIRVLMDQVGYGIGGEKVLVELVKHDEKMTQFVVDKLTSTEEKYQRLWEQLATTPGLLGLFGTLCFSKGKPVRSVQSAFLRKLDEEQITAQLYHTEVKNDTVVFVSPERVERKTITELCEKEQQFYISQIKFLSQICKGTNTEAKKKIVDEKGYVTFDEALVVLKDERVNHKLRAAYLMFVRAVYVEITLNQSGSDIGNIWRSFDWEKITADPQKGLGNTFELLEEYGDKIKELQAIINERLIELKDVKSAKQITVSDEDAFSILNSLVDYGFYWEGELVKKTIEFLLNLLETLLSFVSFEDESCKHCVWLVAVTINTLQLFFNQLSYLGLAKFIYEFKKHRESRSDWKSLPVEDCNSQLRGHFNIEGYESLDIFASDITGNKRLIEILIKLLQQGSDGVRMKSARLLFDMHKREHILFSDASDCYLATASNAELNEGMLLYGSFTDKPDHILQKLQQQKLNESLRKELETVLDEFYESCVPDEDDPTSTNPCGQGIAYSTRVFSRVMNYVQNQCKVDSELEQEDIDILERSCKFLGACMKRKPAAQHCMFNNLMDFVHVGAGVRMFSIARMLTEVFSENLFLCQRLSEPELRQIFQVATLYHQDQAAWCSDQYELCTTLQAAIRVSKCNPVMMRITQETITSLLADTRRSEDGFIHKTDGEARLKYLQECENDDPNLVLLVNIVDLMSVCCEARCFTAKKFCRTIFTVDELVDVLADEKVPLDRKKPFARLLTEAYVYSDKATVCAALAQSNQMFWDHFDYCATLLSKVCAAMESVDKDKVRIALTILSTTHLSLRGWEEATGEMLPDSLAHDEASHQSIPHDDDDDDDDDDASHEETSLRSALLYLWEGAIPLVTAYCSTYTKLRQSGPSSKMYCRLLTDEHLATLQKFGRFLMQAASYVRTLVATESHVVVFVQCMKSLVGVISDADTKIALDRSAAKLASHLTDDEPENKEEIESAAEDELKRKEEIELNDSFQEYVKFFKSKESCVDMKDLDDIETLTVALPHSQDFNKVIKIFSEGHRYHDTNALKILLKTISSQFKKINKHLTSKQRVDLDEMLLNCLHVFIAIINEKVSAINLDQKLTDPEQFLSDIEANVRPVQRDFLECGIHDMVMLHLPHNREEIVVHVMAFMSLLLQFGNEDAQEKVGKFFVQCDSVLFKRLHSILYRASSILFGGRPPMIQFKDNRELLAVAVKNYNRYASQSEEEQVDTPVENVPRVNGEGSVSIPMETFEAAVPNLPEVSQVSIIEEPDGIMWDTNLEVEANPTEDGTVKNVTVVLKLMSGMCDNQHTVMQNLLRTQNTGFSSLNVVGQVATLLLGTVEHLKSTSDNHQIENMIRIARHALQALIECCAGCYKNQETAFKCQVVDALNPLISFKKDDKSDELTDKQKKTLVKLKFSALQLLEALLEETDTQSSVLGRAISDDVNRISLVSCMTFLWKLNQECNGSKDLDQEYVCLIEKTLYLGCHCLRKMGDYLGTDFVQDHYKKSIEDKKKAAATAAAQANHSMWSHVIKWSHGVEIVYEAKDGKRILTKAYFPFDPEEELTKEDKNTIEDQIKRDTDQNKVKDLLDWSFDIKKNSEHLNSVREKWYLKWILWGSFIRFLLLNLLTIVMNLFIIFLFEAPSSTTIVLGSNNLPVFVNYSLPITPEWYHNYVLFILGAVHLLLAIWMATEYFTQKWPHLRVYNLKYLVWRLKKWTRRETNMLRQLFFLKSKNRLEMLEPPEELRGYDVDILSFTPIYTLVFLLCSILSLGTRGYFYCVCLIYIFLVRSDVLIPVFAAVKRSAAQLLAVFALVIVIVYIYAVLSFAFLQEFFNRSDGQFCDSLLQCTVTVMRGGLLDTLSSDTISLKTSSMNEPYFTVLALRMVFDLSFFVIVTVLMLNIVVATLVDRFSAFRDERDEIKEDQRSKCFVCSIDSDDFDQKAHGFASHIRNDHNKWNYIYYVLYVYKIVPSERNALERYVYKKVKEEKRDTGFFPLHKAKVLAVENTNKG